MIPVSDNPAKIWRQRTLENRQLIENSLNKLAEDVHVAFNGIETHDKVVKTYIKGNQLWILAVPKTPLPLDRIEDYLECWVLITYVGGLNYHLYNKNGGTRTSPHQSCIMDGIAERIINL